MANREIDIVDAVPLMLFPLVSGIALGVFSLSINVFGGFSFQDVVLSGQNYSINWAMLLTLLSGAAIVASNEVLNDSPDFGDDWMEMAYFGGIAFAFLAPVGYAFIPAFEDLLTQHDVLSFAVMLLQNAAVVYVSWNR